MLIAVHEALDPEYSILKQRLARRMRYEGMTEEDVHNMDLVQITKVRPQPHHPPPLIHTRRRPCVYKNPAWMVDAVTQIDVESSVLASRNGTLLR